jgi:hypothetical protein
MMINRRQLELPPAVARAFWIDLRAYWAEGDGHKRDDIAMRQLHSLKEHQSPRDKPLRLSDVKAMFVEMKGVIG